MTKQRQLILHLGSNQGDRLQHLLLASEAIESQIGPITQRSQIYQTEAWGLEDQADFLNQAILLDTTLTPFSILEMLILIEKKIGRIKTEKWHPRIIDIDIIFYDDVIINAPDLQIPHPHLHERNFVLVPLLEIIPEWVHPIFQQDIDNLYWASRDKQEVYLYEETENKID